MPLIFIPLKKKVAPKPVNITPLRRAVLGDRKKRSVRGEYHWKHEGKKAMRHRQSNRRPAQQRR